MRDIVMQRHIFPLFNTLLITLVCLAMGLLLGGMAWNSLSWWLISGVIIGLMVGYLFEWILYDTVLYRGRVAFATMLQVSLILFVIAPAMFMIGMTQPQQYDLCPPQRTTCPTPADFGAANYQDVQIPMEDGIQLAGWYVPPTNEAGSIMILLHGLTGNRLQVMGKADILYKEGHGILLYDQRALAESEGARQSFGWLDINDLSNVIDWVVQQPEVNPQMIGVFGNSLGGHISLPAAARDERISALVVEGVAAQHAGDFPPIENNFEYIERFYYGVLDQLLSIMTGLPITPITSEIAAIAPRPVLLISGGSPLLESRTTPQYAEIIGESAEAWVIEGAGHTEGLKFLGEEYADRLRQFYADAWGL